MTKINIFFLAFFKATTSLRVETSYRRGQSSTRDVGYLTSLPSYADSDLSAAVGPVVSGVVGDMSELVALNGRHDVLLKEVVPLDGHAPFEFWLTASTAVGESPPTRVQPMKPSTVGKETTYLTRQKLTQPTYPSSHMYSLPSPPTRIRTYL